MSRIRMKIFISNESDIPLTLIGHEIVSGDLTPDWHPPQLIAPHERRGLQGEGDAALGAPTTGTEGRVRYRVGAAGGELYIHWNSPLIESSYGNTFHVWAPPGWEVSHWGGQGHEAELSVRIRRTAERRIPGFNPNGRGFSFANNAWPDGLPVISLGFLFNKLFEALSEPLGKLQVRPQVGDIMPITSADAGMCGGMVFATMDYFNHRLLPPTNAMAPGSKDDPLFLFIRDRLCDSFDVTGGGPRYLGYSSPHYPDGDEGVLQVAGLARGRAWVSYREEWPRIQDDIDAGRLSPVALVQTDTLDIGANHQVLCYGYKRDGQGVTLFIYDSNFPNQEVTFFFDVTSTSGPVNVRRSQGASRIFCFFRTNGYVPKIPPMGRRTRSFREAARIAGLPQPYSMRRALAGTGARGSLKAWLAAQ